MNEKNAKYRFLLVQAFEIPGKSKYYASRANLPTEEGLRVYETFGMYAGPKRDDESWTAYRNRQAKAIQRSRRIKGRTAGSYSHHKANLANALTRWEKNRNKHN